MDKDQDLRNFIGAAFGAWIIWLVGIFAVIFAIATAIKWVL